MAVYSRQIASAQRTIKRKGQLVTWKPLEASTTDPNVVAGASASRPKVIDTAIANPDVRIAFFPVGKDKAESLRASGVEVTTGSQLGYMGAVDFVPNQKDSVLRNGVSMPIKHIEVIAPNGEAILYEIVFDAAVITGA